jgi:hypothetical protein
VYSVLWGTLMMDYESEDEAKISLSPKTACEVLGISEWDGHGRGNQFPHGLLLVTHTGATYYLCVATRHERDEWLLHIKQALECHFANPDILPFKPQKIIQARPLLAPATACARTRVPLAAGSAVYCRGCGRGFVAAEHVAELSSMLQIGAEEVRRERDVLTGLDWTGRAHIAAGLPAWGGRAQRPADCAAPSPP